MGAVCETSLLVFVHAQWRRHSPAQLQRGVWVSAHESIGIADPDAGRLARRLRVPFLVVDFAKTADGRWIVIECNDGQESGYAAASPRAIWEAVLACETSADGGCAL